MTLVTLTRYQDDTAIQFNVSPIFPYGGRHCRWGDDNPNIASACPCIGLRLSSSPCTGRFAAFINYSWEHSVFLSRWFSKRDVKKSKLLFDAFQEMLKHLFSHRSGHRLQRLLSAHRFQRGLHAGIDSQCGKADDGGTEQRGLGNRGEIFPLREERGGTPLHGLFSASKCLQGYAMAFPGKCLQQIGTLAQRT